jgi:hypothetical protein
MSGPTPQGLFLALIAVAGGAAAAAADGPALSVSATVDKTTVDAHAPLTLTLSLSGDLSGAVMPPPVFPEGWTVAARTQATNVALRAGSMERSTSLVFVLVPSQPGTYQLGPFAVERDGKTLETEAIEITVRKAPLPPTLKPDGERFVL